MVHQAQKPWLPRRNPPNLTLVNVSLVDVEHGTIIPDATVMISGGRIREISANREEETLSRASMERAGHTSAVIDLESAYLCPGFIDLHVHLTAAPGQSSFSTLFSQDQTAVALRAAHVAKSMLYRGFTTVRDTGGSNASLRSAIAENLIPGPRLFIAGKALSQTGGHADLRRAWQGAEFKCCDSRAPGFGRVCDGVPGCLEAARDELRQGADFLKVMCGGGVVSPADPLSMLQFTPEELQAITRTAESIGAYVTAHAYTDSAIRHAVTNGCRGIEHGNFITRSLAEWLKSEYPAVTITPTLATYYAMDLPENRGMFDQSAQAKNAQVLASGLKSLTLLHDLCFPNIGFGTDLLSHMHALQATEFKIRGSVLPAAEVLRQATVNSAKVLHFQCQPQSQSSTGSGAVGQNGEEQARSTEPSLDLQFGVIKEGAWADLLIFRENPLSDAGVMARFRVENEGAETETAEDKSGKQTGLAVIKEGRVVWSLLDVLEVDEAYR